MKRFIILLTCLMFVPFLGAWKVISKQELAQIYEGEKLPELNAEMILNEGIRPYALKAAKPVQSVIAAMDDDFDKACEDYGFRHSVSAFPCNFWIEIKGTIVKIDTKSQSGQIWVLPEGVDANVSDKEAKTIILMIGPAIDSMGPRDGYPDLRYEQFNDQTKFGAFGRSLNQLLSQEIQKTISGIEEGSVIDVIGVLSTWDTPYSNPEIVPVVFK